MNFWYNLPETQWEFLPRISVHENIRLVLELEDYKDLVEMDGFILVLDFYKVFDMVE